MKQFDVIGMSCAACSARVEKAVKAIPGVTLCSVNLLTNSMTVDGQVTDEEIIDAVKKAGYDAKFKEGKTFLESRKKINSNIKKLIESSLLLIILMYFSMGRMFFDIIDINPFYNGLIQLFLSLSIIIINYNFFTNGLKGILNKSPNMDTLVSLGSGASFIYSVIEMIKMFKAYTLNDISTAHLHELYFESAAMILVLISVGKLLEEYSKGKTTNAIKGLINLKPKTALVLKNDKEIEISASKINIDDIFIVKPGMRIPADAVVIEGFSAVNESALTGESIPSEKTIGCDVYTGTINQSGYLKCKTTKTGENTTLSQIIKMVTEASATKAPIARSADVVSGYFVPVVMLIAVVTTIIWMFAGADFGYSLSRGIAVLVISCPCSLGLATPVAIMVGNGVGAKHGVLFKNAVALEETGKVKTVALDKTGTITFGKPEVTDAIPLNNTTKSELIKIAYSLEKHSEHPLAQAIVSFAETLNTPYEEITDFQSLPGNGVRGRINDDIICGGNLKYISNTIDFSDEIINHYNSLAEVGKTPVFFTKNDELIGIIAISDIIKPDSSKAILELKNMGINVVMLTGDNKLTANAIKEAVGVNDVISDVLPDQKEKFIRDFMKNSKTAMVGDGINDAPALTSADVGIAIGAGSDIAIDAADVVLMKNTLYDVVLAIKLSKKTLKNIYENLFWAFIYNIIGIPLAAGVFIPVFGITITPMFAAAAMSLSSFCVVTNALRLNFIKLKGEENTMEKVLKIEGMMCPHCEARVKSSLEAIDGVIEAIPDHKSNTATIKLTKDVSDEILKTAIEEQGYKVL